MYKCWVFGKVWPDGLPLPKATQDCFTGTANGRRQRLERKQFASKRLWRQHDRRKTRERLTSLKKSRSSQLLIKCIILATTKPILVQKFVYERSQP